MCVCVCVCVVVCGVQARGARDGSQLRPGLVDKVDYVAVSPLTWRHWLKWYGLFATAVLVCSTIAGLVHHSHSHTCVVLWYRFGGGPEILRRVVGTMATPRVR